MKQEAICSGIDVAKDRMDGALRPSGTVQGLRGPVADDRFEGIHFQPAKYVMQRGHAWGLFQAESQRLCQLRVLSAPLGDGV